MQRGDYNMVVGVDFSEESAFALDCALRLAGPHERAVIHAIHVTARHSSWGAPSEFAPNVAGYRHELSMWEVHSELLRSLERHCRARENAIGDLRASNQLHTVLRWGRPAAEIVRFAEQRDAALVVVGTHGRQGMARLLVGSVAEEVVRSAPCPVFVARQRQTPRWAAKVPRAMQREGFQ
jgi:nucleotide-binding universal stress UspA family protein